MPVGQASSGNYTELGGERGDPNAAERREPARPDGVPPGEDPAWFCLDTQWECYRCRLCSTATKDRWAVCGHTDGKEHQKRVWMKRREMAASPHATITTTDGVGDWLEPPPPPPPSSPRPAQSAMSDGRPGASLSGALSGPRAFPEGHLSVQPDGGTRILAPADHAPGNMQEPPPPPPPSSPRLSPHAPLPASCWIAISSARFPDDCFRLVHDIQDRFEIYDDLGCTWAVADSLAENWALLRKTYSHLYWIREQCYAGRQPDLGHPEFRRELASAMSEVAGAAQHGNAACAASSRGLASGAADG